VEKECGEKERRRERGRRRGRRRSRGKVRGEGDEGEGVSVQDSHLLIQIKFMTHTIIASVLFICGNIYLLQGCAGVLQTLPDVAF
jgi:hypothetical protein